MFAIPNPYTARRERFVADGTNLNRIVDVVRVIGVTRDAGGAPAYIIEIQQGDKISMEIEPYLLVPA